MPNNVANLVENIARGSRQPRFPQLRQISADTWVFLMWGLAIVTGLLAIFVGSPVTQLVIHFSALALLLLFFAIDLLTHPDRDVSAYIFVPLLMSATQNIYLGIVAPMASSVQIQVMIISNILFAVATIPILLLKDPRVNNLSVIVVALGLGIALYGMLTFVIFRGSITSALSSFRNMETPFVFFLVGLLAAKRTSRNFFFYILLLGCFVILFGICERLIFQNTWHILNIGDLWTKKGLSNVRDSGFPGNFYSSELIGGTPFRRMVSSYGDAVNLGTVLFLVFMVAWFFRKRWLMLASILAIVLAVSKGAFLGLLVFLIIWAYYCKSRKFFLIMLTVSVSIGIVFVVYSWSYSTKSLFGHFYGLINAASQIPSNPLGYGLGRVGVLAKQLSTGSTTESVIRESGLGMVIGQLGIVGLLLYIVFFYLLSKRLLLLPMRAKVLATSLLVAIVLNIAFNEVALSPNSAAGYFLTLGFLSAIADVIKRPRKSQRYV